MKKQRSNVKGHRSQARSRPTCLVAADVSPLHLILPPSLSRAWSGASSNAFFENKWRVDGSSCRVDGMSSQYSFDQSGAGAYSGVSMLVNSTYLDYDANLPAWLRARDVFVGEDAVKELFSRFLRSIIGSPYTILSQFAHYPLTIRPLLANCDQGVWFILVAMSESMKRTFGWRRCLRAAPSSGP